MNRAIVSAVLFFSSAGAYNAYAVPERVLIDGGVFQMGCSVDDVDCENDEGAQGGVSVNVPAFKLDVNEVSVAEYNACISAGKCQRPKDFQRNKYCNVGAQGRDHHPANCVD